MDVTMPDGTIIQDVPEGTTKAQLAAKYAAHVAPSLRRATDPISRAVQTADAAVRGAVDTGTFGLADEISAAVHAPVDAAIDAIRGRGFHPVDAYRRNLAQERAVATYDDNNLPIARGAGQIAGAVIGPGGKLGASEKMLPRLAGNLGYGAAYGFGSGEGGIADRAKNAVAGSVENAIGSEVGRGLMKGVGASLKGLAATPQAQALAKMGFNGATIGQTVGGALKEVEDRLSGFPIIGGPIRDYRRAGMKDAFRQMAEQALQPIGESVTPGLPDGRQITDDVIDKASKQYDAVTRRMGLLADPQVHQSILKALAHPASAEIVTDEVLPRFENGTLTGDKLQEIKEILDIEARKYDDAPGQRRATQAIKGLRNDLLDALEQQNPADALDYANARATYGMAKTVARASAKSTKDGIPTPLQMSQAVRESARRFGPKDAYARGNAKMQDFTDAAAQVLPSSVPDPGTAGQLAFASLLTHPLKYAAPMLAAKGVGLLYSKPGQYVLKKAVTARSPMMLKAGNVFDQIAAPAGVGTGLLLMDANR